MFFVIACQNSGVTDVIESMPPKSVLERAYAVLDSFTLEAPRLTVPEVVLRTGLPKSTVHRIVGSLVEWGALERDGYHLCVGTRLFELGKRNPRLARLRETALPFMEDLYESTHEVVHLGILDGSEVLYVDRIAGRNAPPIPSRVGGRLPAHCTSLGKVLLAFSPSYVVQDLLSRRLQALTPYTIVVPRVLAEQLVAVRDQGVAFDCEESSLGVCCAAAPVFGPDRKLVGAISVSGGPARFDRVRLSAVVRAACAGVTRALRTLDQGARWPTG